MDSEGGLRVVRGVGEAQREALGPSRPSRVICRRGQDQWPGRTVSIVVARCGHAGSAKAWSVRDGTGRVSSRVRLAIGILFLLAPVLGGCALFETLPNASTEPVPATEYLIGPGDDIEILVWQSPDLSVTVPVRPDGRFSMPLIDDLPAAGSTPTQLARVIEDRLREFVQDPLVTVIVTGFVGQFDEQIRVIGEAAQPRTIAYRANMTTLDAMIIVGGLTEFAAGNRATLVRVVDGQPKRFRVRLDDLLTDGDVSANVAMLPGDILIIPESFF